MNRLAVSIVAAIFGCFGEIIVLGPAMPGNLSLWERAEFQEAASHIRAFEQDLNQVSFNSQLLNLWISVH
jgi:hypothetical protein